MNFFQQQSHMIHRKKGYTLLFAVIVSMLVLSIATFILSISRKQAILSSSARDSEYAFYSADSGLECAIEHMDILATSTLVGSMSCGGGPLNGVNSNIAVSQTFIINGQTVQGTSTFNMFTGTGAGTSNTTQSGTGSCASTSVAYTITPAVLDANGNVISATSTTAVVETHGYNIGWRPNPNNDCAATGPRKVERVLQYTQS